MYTYLLNDFEDLRCLIPQEKANVKYKAVLIIY